MRCDQHPAPGRAGQGCEDQPLGKAGSPSRPRRRFEHPVDVAGGAIQRLHLLVERLGRTRRHQPADLEAHRGRHAIAAHQRPSALLRRDLIDRPRHRRIRRAHRPDIVLVVRDRAGQRGVRRARAAAAPERPRHRAGAGIAIDQGELGDGAVRVALHQPVAYRQRLGQEILPVQERPQHRGLHGVASRRSGDGEIVARKRAADRHRTARPVRPVDRRHRADIVRPFRDLLPVRPHLLDRNRLQVGQQDDVGVAPRRDAADPGREPHVPRRIDRHALDRDLRRQPGFDRQPDIMVRRAVAQRIAGAAVVGGQRKLRPVGEPGRDQPAQRLRDSLRPQLDENAGRQLGQDLVDRQRFVVRGQPGGGERADAGLVAQPGAVSLDHATAREGRLDHPP